MSRTEPPKDILDRRKEQPKDKQPTGEQSHSTKAHLIRFLKLVSKFVGILLASLGFVTGYLSLIPRLSVVQDHPLDENNPFSTPFIVSNDGPLGINDLQFSCVLFNVRNTVGGGVSNVETSMALGGKRMEPGERATVPCDTMPLVPTGILASADVAVKISFRPDFTWWRKLRAFRFVTYHASDGHLYWYPQPLSGPISSPP